MFQDSEFEGFAPGEADKCDSQVELTKKNVKMLYADERTSDEEDTRPSRRSNQPAQSGQRASSMDAKDKLKSDSETTQDDIEVKDETQPNSDHQRDMSQLDGKKRVPSFPAARSRRERKIRPRKSFDNSYNKPKPYQCNKTPVDKSGVSLDRSGLAPTSAPKSTFSASPVSFTLATTVSSAAATDAAATSSAATDAAATSYATTDAAATSSAATDAAATSSAKRERKPSLRLLETMSDTRRIRKRPYSTVSTKANRMVIRAKRRTIKTMTQKPTRSKSKGNCNNASSLSKAVDSLSEDEGKCFFFDSAVVVCDDVKSCLLVSFFDFFNAGCFLNAYSPCFSCSYFLFLSVISLYFFSLSI